MKKLFLILIIITSISSNIFGQCGGYTNAPKITLSGTSSVSCYGATDGSISVSKLENARSSDVSYSWSNGETGYKIENLSSGTYTVYVYNSCTGAGTSASYTINTPEVISFSDVNTSDVSCKNGQNGMIEVNTVGGGLLHTYDWSNDGVGDYNDNKKQSTLAAGSYTVNVKDENGCEASRSFIVKEPNASLNLSYTKKDVACFGQSSASIDISPYGGTAPYTYNWPSAPNQFNQDQEGLSAGTYQVTVRDYNQCTFTQDIIITQPQMLTTTLSSTNVKCFGSSDGQISALVYGGETPYNYQWSNSNYVYAQNTSSLVNIPSDIYSVVVTDANNCTVTNTKAVGSPTIINIVSETIDHVKCHGESTGKINLSVIGGTPNPSYVFEWYNSLGLMSGESSNILENIPADNYSVIIKDDNNCSITQNFVVTQPDAPLVIYLNSINDVLCHADNTGGVDVLISGGTPDYSSLWTNSSSLPIGTNEDLENVFADEYTLLVTDANNCTTSESYTINQPNAPLEATNIIEPVICYGESNGSININTTGGTLPYNYNWKSSEFSLSTKTEDLINYLSDTYSLTITDKNGCEFKEYYFIPQPDLLTGSIIGTDILCKDNNTGAVDLSILGGVEPYQYNWTNGSTTQDQENLNAGKYIVTVTDKNYCVFKDSVELLQPDDSLKYEFFTEKVRCYGEDNGEISLLGIGGTPNYSVQWSTNDNSFFVQNLTAGFYSFTLTDKNNCQVFDSIEVTQPDLLLANEVMTKTSCFDYEDGSIDIEPSGGTAPYRYTWYNSDYALSTQNQDLIDFPADVYKLELRDTLNCLTELFIELEEPDELQIITDIVNVTCAGGSDGSVTVDILGGTPDYSFSWSNGATTQNLVDVPVDEYYLEVKDANNCIDSALAIIYEPDSIKIGFDIVEVSCSDQSDGSITALPTGGTGIFTYEWNTTIETEQSLVGIVGGDYTVIVTDIVGCQETNTGFVPTDPRACIEPQNAFTPNGDDYNDTWYLQNIEIYPEANIQIFNKWGRLVYEQKNGYQPWDGTLNGSDLPADSYYYVIVLNEKSKPVKGVINIIR